ncbi:hypothetical protein G6F40_017137 [Rhizopus arrhizus]|nr:hypothetical protein G6F40_017137 [Rhizopus arrhizus]
MASLPAMALQPFKADYLASYMGMQANGSMTLSSEGANKWRYTLQQPGPFGAAGEEAQRAGQLQLEQQPGHLDRRHQAGPRRPDRTEGR